MQDGRPPCVVWWVEGKGEKEADARRGVAQVTAAAGKDSHKSRLSH